MQTEHRHYIRPGAELKAAVSIGDRVLDLGPQGERVCLTRQEQWILVAISYGIPNAAIAGILGHKVNTVKTRISRIFRKLAAADRAHAIRLGFQKGLLTHNDPKPSISMNPAAWAALSERPLIHNKLTSRGHT